jgi:hypothetical protein
MYQSVCVRVSISASVCLHYGITQAAATAHLSCGTGFSGCAFPAVILGSLRPHTIGAHTLVA